MKKVLELKKVLVTNNNGVVTTETHDYILEGNKIIKEIVFEYENNTYFYVRDALGNINHIIDQNENLMVSYEYDECGKLVNS